MKQTNEIGNSFAIQNRKQPAITVEPKLINIPRRLDFVISPHKMWNKTKYIGICFVFIKQTGFPKGRGSLQ